MSPADIVEHLGSLSPDDATALLAHLLLTFSEAEAALALCWEVDRG